MLSEGHWKDLHAGDLFFTTRDAAIGLLDQVEAHIANQSVQKLSLDKPLPGTIADKIRALQQHGQAFSTTAMILLPEWRRARSVGNAPTR